MLRGFNLIGLNESAKGNQHLKAYSPVQQEYLPGNFSVASNEEVDNAAALAATAFKKYKTATAEQKAIFLETIAAEIMALGDELISRAMLETGLPEARLVGERGRTTGQLKLFADLLREGSWVEAVIDEALPERKPLPRSDIRKMLVPIGPVLVFGASNFPFAFSTAGGDTAAALAAGNPVIVKAHESHLGTNEMMATAIKQAAVKCNMPDGIFSFVIGEGPTTGMQLVKHPAVKAIGFTGSYKAGMAIYKAAVNEREVPIPVYAEMSSINPVLILPHQLKNTSAAIAAQLAGSITLGVGQFCTNPGLLFLINDANTENFIHELKEKLLAAPAGVMLNKSVCSNYYQSRDKAAKQSGVNILYEGDNLSNSTKGSVALLKVNAADFIANPQLQNEIFGPASLIISCNSQSEMLQALRSLHGQLTGTVMGNTNDYNEYQDCIDALSSKVGRLIYNGVPTGVEVCHAMVHGGPFPATTDARSTSVGADAIKRFARPFCWQDCPQELLPKALKDDNPLKIMRKVNGQYKR
jgi:NADP-dependent aldehyde dehydrogenase